MNTAMLNADSQAIGLLCSTLGLPRGSELRALTPREWSQLAVAIRDSALARPGAVLGLRADELSTQLSIPGDLARRLESLVERAGQFALEIERLSNRGIWLLTRADDDYPSRLKMRLGAHAPPLFFGVGPRALLTARGVAILGSRDVEEQGLAFATALATRIAQQGEVVFSGAARGVDAAAMLAAISAGGAAVGVVADSLERLAQRRELRQAVVEENLTLISPFHPAAGFNVGHAMQRNRYIYCLADAAVVVASTLERGGTRAGALEDLNANWIPLYVRHDGSDGNEDLLRRGARALSDDVVYGDEPLDLAREAGIHTTLEIGDEPTESETTEREPEEAREPSAFDAVWPLLADLLVQPRTAKETADALSLELGQARLWLKHAADEGFLEARGTERRYRLTPSGKPSRGTVDASASSVRQEVGVDPVFRVIWPLIETILAEPRTAVDVAKTLSLDQRQAGRWLERALGEGLVERSGRERRYAVRAQTLQSTLWNET